MTALPSDRPPRSIVRTALPWLLAVGGLLALPFVVAGDILGLSRGWFLGLSQTEVNFALVTLVAALGLHVLTGRAGEISIGSAGFYALGAAIGGALFVQAGWPFAVVAVITICLGAAIGAVVGLPSLRLHGLYSVLATLAFHFIASYLFLTYETRYFQATGVIYPSEVDLLLWKVSSPQQWYWLLSVLCLLVYALVTGLSRGRQGRALTAVRDQPMAASAAGVNVGLTKVKSWALSSALIALAGLLYATYLTSATVELFSLNLAIQLIAIVVIGGVARPAGAVLGVVVWTLLPLMIDTLSDAVQDREAGVLQLVADNVEGLNNLAFGVAIVLILILRPQGLAALLRPLRNGSDGSVPDEGSDDRA